MIYLEGRSDKNLLSDALGKSESEIAKERERLNADDINTFAIFVTCDNAHS